MDSTFGLGYPYSPPLPLDDADSNFYIPQMADFNLESPIQPLSPPVDSRLTPPTVTPSTIPVSLREPTPSHSTFSWNRIDADSISDFVPPSLASYTLADAHNDACASTSHSSVFTSFQQQDSTNQTAIPDASRSTSNNSSLGDPSSSRSSQKNKKRPSRNNGIPYRTLNFRQRVAPNTGQVSNAENSIQRSIYRTQEHKVDPTTGKPSTAENAISRSTFRSRQLVDPQTGKPSTAENAISKNKFVKRQLVDPITGKPSTVENAIPRNIFRSRQLVDPKTGKPSTAENAIPRNTFHKRQLVDPITGKPSTDANSITYTSYTNRKYRYEKEKRSVKDAS